jgi:hypothetical protein
MTSASDVPATAPAAVPQPDVDTTAIDSAWPEAATPPSRRRPLLGPSLWIFGVLLWAYVVLGELVVTLDFPELLAVLIVLSALAGAWWLSAGRADSGMRRIAPLLIAIGLWAGVIALSARAESGRSKTVALVTIALTLFALLSFALGRYLTRVPRPATKLRRAGRVALWLISALVTLVTLASSMSRL